MQRDIEERTFDFALQMVQFCRQVPKANGGAVSSNQAMRAGVSVGANVEEARAGFTRAEFSYRMNIALREAREVHYWLRLLKGALLAPAQEVDGVLKEAEEIKRILGAIVSKSRKPISVGTSSTS